MSVYYDLPVYKQSYDLLLDILSLYKTRRLVDVFIAFGW